MRDGARPSGGARLRRQLTKAAVPAFAVHALTDITGFGLIGHAREMALASNVSLVFQSANIPVLEGALDCIHAGYIPGGLKANREFAECLVGYDPSVPDDIRTLLFDPQTAGGLLISVSAEDAGPLTPRAAGCRRPRRRNWPGDTAHETFNPNHFLISAFPAGLR